MLTTTAGDRYDNKQLLVAHASIGAQKSVVMTAPALASTPSRMCMVKQGWQILATDQARQKNPLELARLK
jgi:hypothetical protein